MAVAQSQLVARLITERTGREVKLAGVTMFGDVSRAQLAQISGTGVFVSALRTSLLVGDIDIAVHSLKDLPTAQPGRDGGRRRGQRAARAVVVRDQAAVRLAGSVLWEKTLARIRGPATRPTAAPAMTHGSVTVSPRLGVGVFPCDRGSSHGPAAQLA
jgi:hydroxymethylbilane synthase